MSTPLSALIVDDEPLAREGLRIRLEQDPRIRVVGESLSASQALVDIQTLCPDIIFLDIEMPGMNGLELAKSITEQHVNQPKIVFVTAFREFALNAFDFKAFDYLLKPFSDERMSQCLDNLWDAFMQSKAAHQHQKLGQLLNRKTGNSIDGLLQNLEHNTASSLNDLQQTISLKNGSEWLRVRLDGILWIEAAGDYMCVHTQDGSHIIRKTLKQFEQDLDPQHFPRVSRSAMINITKLSKLTPNSNGEYVAQLSSGDQIKVSRKYKFRLDELKKL
ncbi:MAG: response regulator transcription factor [Paraglaciecola sp.]|nr:response regulator transcription factor [Paraglaciecola sp.]NCT48736.1 response regulator transcription factor [Paraglaciecola sp.]